MKIVYITTKNYEQAREVGKKLVEERLAACVNYFPIDSFYRWEDEVKSAQEIVLLVKTKEELVEKIISRVKELHTDEVPCVVSLDVEKGNPDYLNWVDKETRN